MTGQRGFRRGDLILIKPAPISHERNVIIESLDSAEEHIVVPAGTYAVMLKRSRKRIEVMVDGFIGWIFPDEWLPLSHVKDT